MLNFYISQILRKIIRNSTLTLATQMSCDTFFIACTWLGSFYFLLPSTLILTCFLFWAGKSREILLLALGFSTTGIAVHVAKLIFRRPRPDSLVHLVPTPTDWSFPSGHTAQATAFFLSVTLIAIRILPPFWAMLTALFSLLIVIGVGYSRIYLQVHYLSDVLAGMALAAFLVLVVNALLPNRYLPVGK